MLTRTTLLTAVCLSATAGMFVASLPAADEMTPNPTPMAAVAADKRMDFQLPPGITAKDLNSDKAIEKAYKSAAEDALSQKGFDNVVGLLVDQDRVNIAKSLGKSSYNNVDGSDNKHLNDLALSLSNTFKSKYNTKFDIDIAKVYNPDFMQIMTGEVTDANQLVGKWPLDAIDFDSTGGKVTPNDAQTAQKKYFGGDVNLEKGRNVAIAHIAASHGLPGLNISMIHEAGGWKFDASPMDLTWPVPPL